MAALLNNVTSNGRSTAPIPTRRPGPGDEAIERIVAIASLGATTRIHVLQAPNASAEAGYLGGLFVAAVVANVLLAAAALTIAGDSLCGTGIGSACRDALARLRH